MAAVTGKLPINYHRRKASDFLHNNEPYAVFERRIYTTLDCETQRSGLTIPLRFMVDTGAPLCVIPHKIVQRHKLHWTPLQWTPPQNDPAKTPYVPTWNGVTCDIGCLRIWYRPHLQSELRGPVDLIAKFPHRDPKGNSLAYEGLLGLNFLSEHWACTAFQCHTEDHAGTIEFP